MIDATPLFRLHGRRRLRQLAAQDPAAVQEAALLQLVDLARFTRFGADHAFAAIRTVADFQARVPLRSYEDHWHEYWEKAFPRLVDCTWPGTIPYFANSSGTTTGTTKRIPVSAAMVRSNRRAALDLLCHHVANRPGSRVLGGRNFMLGGSSDLVECAPGIRSGDLSGIAAAEVPWWARPRYFPPRKLALIADWEEKVERLAARSLQTDIRAISGTPSWLLLFFDALAQVRDGGDLRLVRYYPRLELLAHGGVSFEPYRRRFAELLDGSRAEAREVYPASEGFIAIADQGYGEGLRMNLDGGLFFEFVPVEELGATRPTRHWLGTVERGVNYALAVTSCAGLWCYLLGDTVTVVETRPPRLLITGRTSYTLSAFGEHLIGEEIERSIAAAAEAIDASVTDYAVGALFPRHSGQRGGHLFIVEFGGSLPDALRLDDFAAALDRHLAALNVDYQDHRRADFGMKPPEILPARPGTFAAWMRRRGKLGGQNKVPRVITDGALFQDLRTFVETR